MTSFLSRRSFLMGSAASLVVVGTAACGSGESGPATTADGGIETADLTVLAFPSFNGLGAAVADTADIFAEKGLNVTLSTAATPAEATPQLLGGQVQFALMDMTVPILARTRQVPLKLVAPGTSGQIPEHDGEIGFVNIWVRTDSDFTNLKDLENSTIAVPQINSQIWQDVRAAIDEDGGDSSKVEFMEAPNTIAALKSGQCDATTTAEPGGTNTLSDPDLRPLAPIESAGGAVAYAYVTTEEFLNKNPNTVAAFMEAILEANARANDDEAARIEAAGSFMDVPPELLEKSIFPVYATEAISETDVTTAIDRMVTYGLLDEGAAPGPQDVLIQS